MSAWQEPTLGEVLAEATPGFACGDDVEDGVFQFRMNNITTEGQLDLIKRRRVPKDYRNIGRFLVQPGDVLFNATNSPDLVGKAAFFPGIEEPAVFSNHFLRLRPRDSEIDGRYLARWLNLQFQRGRFKGMCRQWVNQATVSRDALLSLRIPLPPLPEQRRIAEILDKADALRAKRRAALKKLDELTQSIFLDMFGDPVVNERNWPMGVVGDFVAGFESGKNLVADDEDDTRSLYRVLKVSAVTSLDYRPDQSKALPAGYEPPASHIVRAGDLLFSRANTSELIGATAYAFSTPPNMVLPDKLWRFVWHYEPRADPHFVRFLFRQPKFRREIARRASGTSGSMKNISRDKVLTIRTGIPPLTLQREFGRRVVVVEKLKAVKRAALAELDTLFASLEHRVFRGEVAREKVAALSE